MRKLRKIIVHCLDTPKGWRETETLEQLKAEVDRWHRVDKGWSNGFGYHFMVGYLGGYIEGRPVEMLGAGVKGHNADAIHIALVGGKGSTAFDDPREHFTGPQLAGLRQLISDLMEKYPTITEVAGHNEFAAKACPGFQVKPWWKNKPNRTLLQSKEVIGGSVAGMATVAAAFKDAADEVLPLVQYSPNMKWVFVGLTLAGIGLALYGRIRKWRRGWK